MWADGDNRKGKKEGCKNKLCDKKGEEKLCDGTLFGVVHPSQPASGGRGAMNGGEGGPTP